MICVFASAQPQIIIAFLFGDKLNTGKLEFGIVVSPALTNISNIESKSKPGLNLSIYLNVRPDRKWFLHIEGVGKGAFGAKDILPYTTENDSLDNLFVNGSVQRNIQTFGLPILARYRITELFFAEAGVQANLRLKAEDVFKTKVAGNDLEYTVNVSDQIARFDFGIAGGLFYKFGKEKTSMGVGIRYYQGMIDTHKILSGNQVNTAWLLNITIPIGAGKDDLPTTN